MGSGKIPRNPSTVNFGWLRNVDGRQRYVSIGVVALFLPHKRRTSRRYLLYWRCILVRVECAPCVCARARARECVCSAGVRRARINRMFAAAMRCGAAMLKKAAPVSPPHPPPDRQRGTEKRRRSVVGASVMAAAAPKRRRRATAVGEKKQEKKRVRFSDMAVARVPSGALAGAPHPAEHILAINASSGTETEALRCAVIRFCLASALHPGDSSGAFGQRCVPTPRMRHESLYFATQVTAIW